MSVAIKKYNVVIADSQYLITESLKILIGNTDEYITGGLANNLSELRKILDSGETDLLITDYNLMDYDGFDSLKRITTEFPKIQILILTNHVNRNELNEFTKLGIKNIIYKTADLEEILRAMDSAVNSRKYYSGEVLDILIESNAALDKNQETLYLTPSEIEIVKLIAEGLTTKEIAASKHISFHTVMSHRKNIFRKLNINNASELLMYAVRAGLIDNIEYYI